MQKQKSIFNCYEISRLVATFFTEYEFLSELQPRGFFRTILDVICTKYLPDLEHLLLGRFLSFTDNWCP
jgi:hypothetical protein